MKNRLFLAALMASSSLFAVPAIAEEGNWMIRGRVITTVPDEGATLSTGGVEFPGSVDISNQVMPELDITYFFTKNIAAELILAVTPHDVTSTKVSVGDVLLDADVPLGDTLLLPPTLTLQYHFDTGTRFKPYVGGGVNLTFFLTEDEGDIADSIDYETTVGWAAQAGFDFDLDGEPGGWLFNADVKRIWLDTDVEVDLTSALGPALGANSVIVDAEVDIDPWIFGVGFGYRF
ncbi:MAG: OmpW family outer membrane protein [Pseudomonadota bacterium]